MKSFILSLVISVTYILSAVAQIDDQSVVAASEYLTKQTENTDNDADKINVLNFLTQTKTAENGLQEIINALGVATSEAAQAPKTSDEGEEQNIQEAISQFTAALIGLARDLISHKFYFKAAFRESTVHDDIQTIRADLLTYFSKVGPLITNQDIRDALAESIETAYSELGTAQTEFEN